MSNQLIDKIKVAVEEFRKVSKRDFDCPAISFKVNDLFFSIRDSLIKRVILREELREILGVYKLVTQDSGFSAKALYNNFKSFKDEFLQKRKESIAENKKLLVVMGETHDHQDSMFFEFIISTFLKFNGFNSALIEDNADGIKRVVSKDSDSINGFSIIFCKNVLDMKLIPIDPLHDPDAENLLNIPRCNAINSEIAQNSEQDQMAIVGASHLEHIINSKEISDKFIILPISVSVQESNLPAELVKSNRNEGTKDHEGILTLSFSNSIESFSLNKLLDIYVEVLPMIIGDEELPDGLNYHSDFSNNYGQCKEFDNIPVVIAMFEAVYGGLIDDSMNDL